MNELYDLLYDIFAPQDVKRVREANVEDAIIIEETKQ